jgi:hypothetical protein
MQNDRKTANFARLYYPTALWKTGNWKATVDKYV